MYQILSKMFEIFLTKQKRLENKVERYIQLEKEFNQLNGEIDDLAEEFQIKKSEYDILDPSNTPSYIVKSVVGRFKVFEQNHIVNIGKLKKKKDNLEKSLTELLTGDFEFLNIVEEEKKNRKINTILSKYRSNNVELSVCDTLLKSITKEKVKYADNIVYNQKGQILLLKRSELDESKPGYYTIPGGHVDLGEDCETAAKRELEEEAGIKVKEVTQVGEYEDEKVHIKYYQSYTDQEPTLQEEEIWSYEWVDLKDLKDYNLPLNMNENLDKILFTYKQQIVKIKKSFESGLINKSQRTILLKNVIEKAKQHKYIRKEFKNGKWEYIYEELKCIEKIPNNQEESKEIAESILSKLKKDGIDIKFSNYSSTNGQSIYYKVSKGDKELKVRISDHSVTNKDRIFNEIHIPFGHKESILEQPLNQIRYELGIEGYKYGKTKAEMPSGKILEIFGYYRENSKNEKVKKELDYAEQIIKGKKQIKRLSPEEEQGRIAGGRINVEATIELGTSSEANEEFPNRKNQLDCLEKLSKENGYFIEDYEKIFGVENRFDKATESEVFYDNSGYVIKINNFSQHEDISEMFDRVSIQNLLFPDTKYEILGFTKRDGELNVILKQPFIEMKVGSNGEVVRPSKKELSVEMEKLGYKDQGGDMFTNDDYIIEDLHSANVCFSKDGILMFIDPVIRINLESEGYGGKRKLGRIDNDYLDSLRKSDHNSILGDYGDEVIEKLKRALSKDEKYKEKLKKLKERRDPENKEDWEIKSEESDLEKAWTKHPVGTIVTRKDGQKYKKVSETGNSKQDWQLVSKQKTPKQDEISDSKQSKQEEDKDTKVSEEDLKEHAKNTSETALNNAIKQSDDPKIREAAHQEIYRREKEEKPQDKEKVDLEKIKKKAEKILNGLSLNHAVSALESEDFKDLSKEDKIEVWNNVKDTIIQQSSLMRREQDIPDWYEEIEKKAGEDKKEENKHVEKFRALSDEQIKFYLDAPYPEVKKAAKMVADERGLSVVSKEDYIKQFEDWSKKDNKTETLPFYENDSKRSQEYLSKNKDVLESIDEYKFDGFVFVRDFLSNEKLTKEHFSYQDGENEVLVDEKYVETMSLNISKFINENKIERDLSLNRRVLTGNTFFTKLKEGDLYEDKSFSSTSLKELPIFGDFNIKILAKKGSSVANVVAPGEMEYLIDKGSKFRVVEKHENGLGITVELL